MDQETIRKQNIEFLIDESDYFLDWAFAEFKEKVFATTAFGANGLVLLDLIKKKKRDMPVYFIDTGYHFSETLEIKEHYKKQGFNIIELNSTVDDRENLLQKFGSDICCRIRKVEPLRNLMKEKQGHLWITALSWDQSETRRNIRFLEPQDNSIVKFNAMLAWKEDQIWQYIREHNLTYNKLYNKGYKSIGCKPCTTPVEDEEDGRAGRWRGSDKKECGLHVPLKGD